MLFSKITELSLHSGFVTENFAIGGSSIFTYWVAPITAFGSQNLKYSTCTVYAATPLRVWQRHELEGKLYWNTTAESPLGSIEKFAAYVSASQTNVSIGIGGRVEISQKTVHVIISLGAIEVIVLFGGVDKGFVK